MKAILMTTAALAAIAFTGIPAPAQDIAPVPPPHRLLRPWEALLASELPRLGHRNFIVIADSAYPLQSAPGIRTVATGADHIEVLRAVLDGIAGAGHVKPRILLDQELRHLTEDAAPGIGALRGKVAAALGDAKPAELPHLDIIRKLDEASALFNVLILKTTLALPYTSVFIELDCGYWSEDKEAALRAAMEGGK